MLRKAFRLSILMSCAGCAPAPSQEDSASDAGSRTSVYVVSYPLAYFAERIGGDRVTVSFPVPPGVDARQWRPDAETITAYQSADVILLNGAEYSKWVPTVSLPASKLIDTSASFAEQIIVVEDAVTHSHGPEGQHSHGETASITWLDPTLAVKQAEAIRDALVKARPDSETYFETRFESLRSDLLSLDEQIRAVVGGRTAPRLLASYPLYPYLARRYGLDMESLRFDPADMTGGDFWHDVQHSLERRPASWMLWPREPSPETLEKLQALGVESVVIDPCEERPDEGDFLTVMRQNTERLGRVFE